MCGAALFGHHSRFQYDRSVALVDSFSTKPTIRIITKMESAKEAVETQIAATRLYIDKTTFYMQQNPHDERVIPVLAAAQRNLARLLSILELMEEME
jgi:uncharacterized protein YcgL (UPF0745 family)